ncbi:MAG: hypothetical protein OHK0053_06110 [Microscillaceae bacterium]
MAEGPKLTIADEKMQFEFTPTLRRKIFTTLAIGLLLLLAGIGLEASGVFAGGHGAEEHALLGGGGDAHGHYHWTKRLWANFWLCCVYFTGIALAGVFFVSVNYVAWAGWSALIKRVPEAFGGFLPITFVLMLILFFVAGHDLFHWTHEGITDPKHPNYDSVIAKKAAYLNVPFYLARTVVYFGLWYLLFAYFRKLSKKEDQVSDYRAYLENPTTYNRRVYFSAVFLVVFAVTTSMAAWDWVMSIDSHWFSTMFGWYNFASWFVASMATITLAVIYLKESGYLKLVNQHHLHDLGKFMFAFSIFWTYIWFSQFLLIYYAHIPEETFYWEPRLFGHYRGVFFLNLFVNFSFPFLALMTKESKRTIIFLKIVAIAILIGHYLDFYMMIMPGTVGDNAGFFLLEFGTLAIFIAVFIFMVARGLAQLPLIPKNDPYLKESIYFTQF